MPPGPGRGMNRFLSDEEKASAPKVTWPLLKRVFSYLWPYKFQFLLALILIGVSSVLDMYPSILTGKIVDDGLIGRSMETLVRLIIISFVLKVGSNLIGVFQNYLNAWIAQLIT